MTNLTEKNNKPEPETVGNSAATLVKGILWQAIEGDPVGNAQLKNLLETVVLLTPDDIRTMVEELVEEAVEKKMKDLDQWDFLRLVDVLETKTDVNERR